MDEEPIPCRCGVVQSPGLATYWSLAARTALFNCGVGRPKSSSWKKSVRSAWIVFLRQTLWCVMRNVLPHVSCTSMHRRLGILHQKFFNQVLVDLEGDMNAHLPGRERGYQEAFRCQRRWDECCSRQTLS